MYRVWKLLAIQDVTQTNLHWLSIKNKYFIQLILRERHYKPWTFCTILFSYKHKILVSVNESVHRNILTNAIFMKDPVVNSEFLISLSFHYNEQGNNEKNITVKV